jgi:hypothetical protein
MSARQPPRRPDESNKKSWTIPLDHGGASGVRAPGARCRTASPEAVCLSRPDRRNRGSQSVTQNARSAYVSRSAVVVRPTVSVDRANWAGASRFGLPALPGTMESDSLDLVAALATKQVCRSDVEPNSSRHRRAEACRCSY